MTLQAGIKLILSGLCSMSMLSCALNNDVSSDVENPPKILVHGETIPFSSSSKTYVETYYPELTSLTLDTSCEQAFKRALYVAETLQGWGVHEKDEENFRFQAIAVTRFLRFKDDVAVELRPDQNDPQHCLLSIRSRSRVGKSDLGANIRRIRSFFKQLEEHKHPL